MQSPHDSSPKAPIAVGIDGGGTSTRVLLMGADSQPLGQGRSGSGNLHDVGAKDLMAHINEAWRRAWAHAGAQPRPAAAAFCAMASVGTTSDRETVRGIVASVGVAPLECTTVDLSLIHI